MIAIKSNVVRLSLLCCPNHKRRRLPANFIKISPGLFLESAYNKLGSDDYRVKFSWQTLSNPISKSFHASQTWYVSGFTPVTWHAGLMIRYVAKTLDWLCARAIHWSGLQSSLTSKPNNIKIGNIINIPFSSAVKVTLRKCSISALWTAWSKW